MMTFTFDDRYFFEPEFEVARARWHVFEQPSQLEGYFSATGRLWNHGDPAWRMTVEQAEDVQLLLMEYGDQMDLRQFEVHKNTPNHHLLIDPKSSR